MRPGCPGGFFQPSAWWKPSGGPYGGYAPPGPSSGGSENRRKKKIVNMFMQPHVFNDVWKFYSKFIQQEKAIQTIKEFPNNIQYTWKARKKKKCHSLRVFKSTIHLDFRFFIHIIVFTSFQTIFGMIFSYMLTNSVYRVVITVIHFIFYLFFFGKIGSIRKRKSYE